MGWRRGSGPRRRPVGVAVVARGRGGAPAVLTVGWTVLVVALVVTLALVLAAGPGAGGAVGAEDGAEPAEPVLVIPGASTDGQVHVRPATQAPDDRGLLTWTLDNGGGEPVELALAIHETIARDGEVAVGRPHDRLRVTSRPVRLAPGEVARVRVPVPDDLAPHTVALVASGMEADVEVVGLALVGAGDGAADGTGDGAGEDGGAAVRPRVRGGPGERTITVRLEADAPALVDVAVRATAWPGLARDEQVLDGVLVPAGGRDVPVAVSGPVAGRVVVDVAVSGQPAGRTSAALWWWPRELLVSLAIALLVVAGGAVLLVGRRRRRRGV